MQPVSTRPHLPGYGIDPGPVGLLPWHWAEQVLDAARTWFLATVRADGLPHLMPVWAVRADGAIWFSSGAASRKARNLAHAPVCSIAAEAGRDSVVIEGHVTRLDPADVPPAVAARYRAAYGAGWPDDSPVFRITPQAAFGFSEPTFAASATRWTFG